MYYNRFVIVNQLLLYLYILIKERMGYLWKKIN